VLGPFSTYTTAAARLADLVRRITATGREAVVFDHRSSAQRTDPLLASLPRSGRLDGLILVSVPVDGDLATRIRDTGLPTVLLDGQHPALSSVLTDDDLGGRIAAEHLLELGHTRMALLAERQVVTDYDSPTDRRRHAYTATIRAATGGDPVICATAHDLTAATASATALLHAPARPTAIFASNDLIAAGALRAARDLGLDVPTDLSVIGYDDGELAAALDLTSIHQPIKDANDAAVETLQQILTTPAHRRITVPVRLQRRRTTGSAP
jgi:LacI family transcriptional regulator